MGRYIWRVICPAFEASACKNFKWFGKKILLGSGVGRQWVYVTHSRLLMIDKAISDTLWGCVTFHFTPTFPFEISSVYPSNESIVLVREGSCQDAILSYIHINYSWRTIWHECQVYNTVIQHLLVSIWWWDYQNKPRNRLSPDIVTTILTTKLSLLYVAFPWLIL